jgi:hypothetical protein
VIVKEMRCRPCGGDLFSGSEADGWVCVACGRARPVFVAPKPAAAVPSPTRGRKAVRVIAPEPPKVRRRSRKAVG